MSHSHSEEVLILCTRDSTISAWVQVHMRDRTDQRGCSAAIDLGVVARRMYWGKDKYKRKGRRNMRGPRCTFN
jgi:hypothetical protein